MKILIIILVVNIAFSKSIMYDLKADGKNIGTLSVKTEKIGNKGYTYKTYLRFSRTYIFTDYTYEYRENAFFDKDGLVNFTVEEKIDGEHKKMSAKREGTVLVFANGKKIKLSQLDVTPFDIDETSKYDDQNIKKFTLKSFDGLTAELVDEIYKVLGSEKVDGRVFQILEKRNSINNEVETLTITASGKLLKVKTEDFEMILRTKEDTL